ncbi:hypothetical protein [Clostridium sp. Cult2]|uniref:hypothetical protein n=1 Tax=Clostridium sp. Cult2 TaxID=2079003 RepID=UPI001F3F9B00|nr:hypothetical protein [Clostridium sp. Cult2]MCF6466093.1 hypothetical protein [Clostridium sp. Cult2]
MKLLKRSIGIAFLFIIAITGSVFANTWESILDEECKMNNLKIEYDESKMDYLPLNENDINTLSPMVVDACPGRGDHEMFSHGVGTLIRVNNDGSKDTIFKGGAA